MIRVIIIILVVYGALYLYTYPETISRVFHLAFSGVDLPVVSSALRQPLVVSQLPPRQVISHHPVNNFVRISDARGSVVTEYQY